MKKLLLLSALMLVFATAEAQKRKAWQEVSPESVASLEKFDQEQYSASQQLLAIDMTVLKQSLVGAPESGTTARGMQFTLPTLSGDEQFAIWETSNFAPELRAQYPDIKSYVGKGITDKGAYLRFSIAPTHGLSTMILRQDRGAEFIESYTRDRSVYVMFDSKTRVRGESGFKCMTDESGVSDEFLAALGQDVTSRANNQVFKTFRLALSCTAEYTTFHGGTVAAALAGMNATMTRVNGVFDVDMALKLEIIANNHLIIFTNATNDPYSSAGVGAGGAWNLELQNTLSNTAGIGNAAYDIGHLFGASGGGGNAGCIGCVCVDDNVGNPNDLNKGSAYTSPSNGSPQGDSFDIDYVVHEMGHQLGATHTFSHQLEFSGTNIETGSGVTIMGYAGVTGNWDVAQHSIPIFAYRSILQMQTNLSQSIHNCSTNTALSNTPPTVDAGPNWTIPKGTAFILTGTGSDPDGDVLSYVWEQNDVATTAVTGNSSIAYPTKTVGPTFRTFLPTASPVRIMPQLSAVLAGNLTGPWESVSNVGRNLNFNFTARDNHPNGGQTQKDANVITVSPTIGPFAVTSQSVFGLSWIQGSSETVTWNVAGTTGLTGSANVNILLSVDGGNTWPHTLASNTPNDGSETIIVPFVTGENCRIWVQPTANIYFAVNSAPFSIGYSCNLTVATPNLVIPDGAGSPGAGPLVETTINVTTPGTIDIANMKVNVSINHDYMGDLVVRLKHPDNSTRNLLNRPCNSVGGFANANLVFQNGAPTLACASSPLTGTVAPQQNFSIFNGKPTNGTWTLTAQDFYVGQAGTVTSWGLNFGCVLGNPEFDQSNFVVSPNPNSGMFTVEYTSPVASDVDITVHDIRGRLVFQNKYENTGLFYQNISLNSAEAGIYLVTVRDGNRKMVKKIVVE